MTPERLAEIRARIEKATPGPWTCGGPAQISLTFDSEANIIPPDTYESHGFQYGGPVAVVSVSEEAEDWPFIQHARTDVPDLCDALAAAQERIAELEAALGEIEQAPYTPSDDTETILDRVLGIARAALAGSQGGGGGEEVAPASATDDEPWCTVDRHIVLPSGEACVCGENRMELML